MEHLKKQNKQEHTTTYPTVVIDMNAHQKPSQVPLENEEGKFSEFFLASYKTCPKTISYFQLFVINYFKSS